ncbi:MFS transporter [Nocardioides psychrotolerans]|uniref:Major Facilitator Superfamily protein n=1 Tax=Nocardioides psychrotolerans TaxID=1005945 RepID=A0A1I3M0E0_9ACTN|nr:MFS transporter [Nocardioides psychrotolerans]GEP38981.1 MFS transporter [Nocardioides psychrotolerans]SFI90462.1 Major Facilitator Superfamily protein [Nocardioides psychrotolerans]
MSPLASYRRLFDLAGPLYVAVAFLGRLPLSMSQIGTMLLVSSATGSYGIGGLAAGALAVANAIGSPVAGELADRVGQRPVVLVQSIVGAVGLVALVSLTGTDAADGSLIATAGLVGLVLPQVGPLARVRWRPITRDTGHRQPRLMDAAFSYEGAADEASFVLGPALVGVVVVLVSPSGAMLLAAALLAVFGCAFAAHPTARLTGGSTGALGGDGRILTAVFVGLLLAQGCLGLFFGSIQTGTTALATEVGRPGLAGIIHSCLGVGSVLAGLATVAISERVGQERRVLVSASALVVLSLPLLLVDSVAGLIVTVLFLGFGVAPYMIGVFSIGERAVPAGRVGLAMTLLAGATGIGYAVGSTLAGRLADLHGHPAAFAVTVSATVLAVALATLGQRPVRRMLAQVTLARADAPLTG